MVAGDSSEMSDSDIDNALGRSGTGVLSLAAENVPYSTPVSYGYDPDVRRFYLRLGFVEDSEKRDFVDASAEARLVTYGRSDDGWQSVVAVGPLERIDDDELTIEIADSLRRADPPLIELWDEPGDEIEFRIYRLEADRVTGRKGRREADVDRI